MARNHYRKIRRLKRAGINSRLGLRIRAIWRKRSVRVALGLCLVLLVFLIVHLFNKYTKYDDYEVVRSVKVDSGTDSKYVPFQEFVVKYSGDGISYIDGEETVWEEGYQMKSPMIDVCDTYFAVADKNTNDIFIYNDDGRQGKVTTSYPIVKLEVAYQGVVAALLEDQGTNYIEVYDKEGNQLVSHKTLIGENGYPIDFSLSEDGTKMMVSYLVAKKGSLTNKIMFYNFSGAGQNATDRMVGQFEQYGETVVPSVNFVTNSDAVAVGENIVSIYKMKDEPKLSEDIEVTDEIQKVFFSEEYIGLVLKNQNGKMPYRVEVYSLSGRRKMKVDISTEYDKFSFSGENVLMANDMNCQIISLSGVKKFAYTFKGEVNSIIPVDGSRTYLFMTNTEIQKVRLK